MIQWLNKFILERWTLSDLQLRSGGKLFVLIWNGINEEFVEREIEYEDLSYYAHHTICLENGITLRDVFLLFLKDIGFFASTSTSAFMNELIEDMSTQIFSSNSIQNEISALSVGWVAKNDKEGLFLYSSFVGIGEDEKDFFELTSIDLNEISTLPIILNTKLNIIDMKSGDILFSSKKLFLLSDFAKAILEEFGGFAPIEIIDEDIFECTFETNMYNSCIKCGKSTSIQYFNKPKNICIKCFKKDRLN
jgi:hypothetical protein